MKKCFFFLTLTFLTISCTRNTEITPNDEMIFGIYNGFCAQSCSNLFFMKDGKLYADDEDQISDFQNIKFQETALPDAKYKLAQNAYDNLPQILFDDVILDLGCPGCVDQDIVYIKYFDGADYWEWRIDTDEDELSSELADYVHQMKDLIDDLK